MRDRDSVNCFYSVTNLIANCHDNYKIIPIDLKCQADISYETQRRGRDLDVGRPIGIPLGDWGQVHSKRHLLLGRKAMTNLDSIWKSRDITLLTKINKAMAFPGVMCGCENWTIKEGEPFGAFKPSWCFQTVVLEKTLESPLDCKEIKLVNPKGNQSWIFIGRTMLKLKLKCFGHLMWRTDSLEKTLMLEKIEVRRRRGLQRMRCLESITNPSDINLCKLLDIAKDRGAWHAAVNRVTKRGRPFSY